MSTNIQSHSNDFSMAIKQFLMPSAAQTFVYVLVSLLLMMALSGQQIWAYFNNQVLSQQESLSSFLNADNSWFHSFLGVVYRGRTLEILFWLFVGCAVYVVAWFIKSIVNNVRNDLVADEYMHPQQYNRSQYWHSVLMRKLFFCLSAAILTGYGFACFKLLPTLSRIGYLEISNFSPLHSLLELSVIVVCTAFFIHILTVLVRATVNSWQLIYADL